MKKLVALLCALAGVASLMAQYPTTQTTPAPAPAPQTPTAPAVKPAPPGKPVEKEEPKIPGIVLQRPTGGNQMGLTLSGGSFKVSFFDKKRKAIQADVTRARAVWNPSYKALPEQTVLNIVDNGKALGGGKPVRAPLAFKLRLTLLKGEGDAEMAAEPTYVIDVTEAGLNQK